MSPWTDEHSDRHLVQQLMLHGWYRLGQGPRDESGRATWGFREGHLLETPHANTLWIGAVDELSAMRKLMAMLHADARIATRCAASQRHDTGPDDQWPDQESMASTPDRQRVRMRDTVPL